MLFLVKSVDPVENMVSVDDNLLTGLVFHLHDFAETSAIDNIIKNNIMAEADAIQKFILGSILNN